MEKTILVTGACGYIGSHTCIELLQAGYKVVAIDNLCNSSRTALDRAEEIAGQPIHLVISDVRDRKALDAILRDHEIDAVIHFAGLKAVGESVQMPLTYYENNVHGTINLLQAMDKAGVRRIVFSSSATVYGDPESVPIHETARLQTTNPYGSSKLMVEQVINDLVRSDARWQAGILRYFNPVGAHPSGLIGEDPRGIPNNLMPFVAQVAVGRRDRLVVFGNDYPTPDGTGVRDYIHVVDLARGHVAALDRLFSADGSFTVNLGTGRGYSVLEAVRAFEAASGRAIPYVIEGRRAGDIAVCYACPDLALELLGWAAQRDLAEMCEDHWRWQSGNPEGY
ncbi:UDP-glucose 4-epimerase GalE [Lacisediminimonas sp.]|uniref:UDP-glucose 4-epimerase GalE n=1 Tax=Lacisediminimonas sp. TaxID=3060582 RepID=UPI00271C4A69|nr:UDP-glucose 4-epimerase GalE [Lacisediminimonas sp.]MDO8301341.1 UDP-glucose 4-epimerase GalE [Lacisediminimonas sp.]